MSAAEPATDGESTVARAIDRESATESVVDGNSGLLRRDVLRALPTGAAIGGDLISSLDRLVTGTEPALPGSSTSPGRTGSAAPPPVSRRGSFRDIAAFLDPVDTPISLRGLSDLHRWTPEENPLSFRSMVRRHTSPHRTEQRFLFLNTFLMDIKDDKVVPGGTKATKPMVDARTREIGRDLVGRGVDIAALAEVWRTEHEQLLLDQFPSEPAHVGNIDDFTFHSSGVLVLSTGLGILSAETAFERYRSATGFDQLVEKGVQLAALDVGSDQSALYVYATHLQAGDRPVALDQLLQLAVFVRETRPSGEPAIVAGDFNINDDPENTPIGKRWHRTAEVVARYESSAPEPLPTDLRRAVREPVADGTPTGERVALKTAADILTDVFAVLGFRDLWAERNGEPGYTKNVDEPAVFDRYCPASRVNPEFCSDHVPHFTGRSGRVDYVFVSDPSPEASVRLDFTRPRRPRTDRPPGAPKTGAIEVLSDHLGVMTTLRLVPA